MTLGVNLILNLVLLISLHNTVTAIRIDKVSPLPYHPYFFLLEGDNVDDS